MLQVVLLLLKWKLIEVYVLIRTLIIVIFLIESITICIISLELNITV